ncbi:MAG: helix-turn-helix transcriptional regulator [Planctomycetota bacterium]
MASPHPAGAAAPRDLPAGREPGSGVTAPDDRGAAATGLGPMLESFETLLQAQVTIYDFADFFQLDGRSQIPRRHTTHDRCGFCRFVKDDLGRMRDCLRGDMEPIVLRERRPARWRRCHAGVWEVHFTLWDGAALLGALMVGGFRRGGERPLIELPMAGARTGKRAEERRPVAAASGTGTAPAASSAAVAPADALHRHHVALRALDPNTDRALPALVENFALGLVRAMLQLRRGEAPAGAALVESIGPAGASGKSPVRAAPPAAPTARRVRSQRTRAIELFVGTHLAQGTQLADLANHLHLSLTRTSQILRREMETSFPALMRRARLNEARRLLVVSELPIGRIAELAGFADRNYFCRVFTRVAGMTPTEFRRREARSLRA